MRDEPCGVFVPDLRTRFRWTPPVELVISEPPVVTFISWNMSKSQYVGVAPVAAMSVMGTPSRFQVASEPVAPLAWYPDCWPDSDPPTFTRSMMMPGTVCMTTHGSRPDGT